MCLEIIHALALRICTTHGHVQNERLVKEPLRVEAQSPLPRRPPPLQSAEGLGALNEVVTHQGATAPLLSPVSRDVSALQVSAGVLLARDCGVRVAHVRSAQEFRVAEHVVGRGEGR